MDQDTVVKEQTESGTKLIGALLKNGIEVRVAFWAKPTEAEKWYLYLASPVVDEQGQRATYRRVFDILRNTPDLWIDPLEIKLLRLDDSLTEAALAVVTRPKASDSPFAIRNQRPCPGMTRFGGSTLGGLDIDGAYIYPTLQMSAPA